MHVDRLAAWMAVGACTLGTMFATAAGTAPAPAPDATQPFGIRDLVRLERLADLAVSPDGKRVAYTLRSTDMEANKGRTGIWLLDAQKRNAAAARLTDLAANASSAEWSADGRYVYFLSNRSGSTQVWRIETGRGDRRRTDSRRLETGSDDLRRNGARHGDVERDDAEPADAQQITNLPLDVGSFLVSPSADRLLVSMEVFIDCADLACTKRRLDGLAHAPAHGVLYDKLFVRHWDTWSDGRRSQLFSIALDASGLANGTPLNLSGGMDGDVPGKPFGGREDYAFSPDGRNVAFSLRLGAVGEPWSTNFDIYEVAAGGGKPRNLTGENPAWDGQPAFSPDGTQLAYVATDRPGFEADRFHLVLLNLASGSKRPLTQDWDRSISSFAWSPDGKTLFATADHLGQHPLWAIDVGTGHASALTGDGEVEGFAVGPRKLFFTASDLKDPADMYSVGFAGGKAHQLTHLNQAALAQRKLGDYEQFEFPGWNDENVFGYVVKPVDFKRDGHYPVAFVVHGGPQ